MVAFEISLFNTIYLNFKPVFLCRHMLICTKRKIHTLCGQRLGRIWILKVNKCKVYSNIIIDLSKD